jgi:hypothetical protein
LGRKFKKIGENGKNPLDSSEIVVYPIILENRIFCFVGSRSPFWARRGVDERKPTSNERRSARLFQRRDGDVADVWKKRSNGSVFERTFRTRFTGRNVANLSADFKRWERVSERAKSGESVVSGWTGENASQIRDERTKNKGQGHSRRVNRLNY